ncbi:RagB/SusD family nutrient uptake outer membrane protein [Sphingobacterium lactis]|uniref:RagB/SusD family nutrient uptake outer membrane protein n=1 Tax=Sphingobacterium lactis TaxID=797291 RepID=UPI003DA2B896
MKKHILLFLSIFLLCGCEKFLDVAPDDRAYEKDIFLDQDGFTKSLTGVYKFMAQDDLYQQHMKFKTLDLLVHYWEAYSPDGAAEDLMAYKYENLGARIIIDGIWGGLYNAIHQVNIIIDNLPNIEGEPHYNLIAGEAYGLRAYLHLEVFKLYGPVVKKEGLSATAIPYYESSEKNPVRALSAKEVLAKVEQDLQQAAVFFKEDPIQTLGREGDGNNPNGSTYSALLDRRGIRMNYYAVKALLARKSLWEGDLPKAYERSMAVINELKESKAVRFIQPEEVDRQKNKDLRFTSENIFALYDRAAMNVFTANFLNNNYEALYARNLEYIYNGGTSDPVDIRLKWGINGSHFSKYTVTDDDQSELTYNPKAFEIQMINLPEMYFTAAEAKIEADPAEFLRLMNEFRKNRSFREDLKMDGLDLQQLLIDEVRREYIGEGYLFSFLKRKYLPIPTAGDEIPASLGLYKFPVPVDEKLYN